VPVFSRNYKVLTYDVRGFGETEITGGPYSMELFAEDLYELLKALNIDSACVLGFSMGGRIALEFALKHPEMAAGLVFANSGAAVEGFQPSAEEMAQMEERRKMMEEVLKQGDMEAVAETMTQAAFSPGFKEKNPEAYQRFKEIKEKNRPEPLLAIREVMAAGFATPPDLSPLKCPILIIVGEADSPMAMGRAKAMGKVLKNAVLKTLPTGHASAIETPDEFNQIVLDFLKGL
jgi:2-hydroxy-6-oxonona-2,4-dienedioate hydrolase